MENQTLLTGTLEPIQVEQELFVMEVAYEQYKELHKVAFQAQVNKEAGWEVLDAKCEKALEASARARHKLEKFVLASYKMEQLYAEIDHINRVKDYFTHLVEDGERLEAVVASIKAQAHLIPVVYASLMSVKPLCEECGEEAARRSKYCRECNQMILESLEAEMKDMSPSDGDELPY